MSKPTDAPDGVTDRDPVQELSAHLEHALASLARLREVLPPPSSPTPDMEGGDSA